MSSETVINLQVNVDSKNVTIEDENFGCARKDLLDKSRVRCSSGFVMYRSASGLAILGSYYHSS